MNQNFTLFLQAGCYTTKWERALRATICSSMERVRPRDAADVYIKTSKTFNFLCSRDIDCHIVLGGNLVAIPRHWKMSTAGSRQCSNYKSKQMRESLSLFFKQVYLFKVNLFVKEANSRSQCFSPFLA